MKPEFLVIGLGNELMGDDGVGPETIKVLRPRIDSSWPVRLKRAADVFALLDLWHGEPSVWLIDAISSGASPGTMQRFVHEEVLALPGKQHSVHGLSLAEALRWMMFAKPELRTIRFELWGVEVSSVRPEGRSTDLLRNRVSRLADALIQALTSL
jgi:hydrogenase maturation protease